MLKWIDPKFRNHEIEDAIQELKAYYIANIYPTIMSKNQFKALLEENKCFYCKITKKELDILYDYASINTKRERGYSFELDRKHPNKEYSYDNTVVCCYWCNNAKTDEFIIDDKIDEFSPIGQAIGNIFRQRLKRINNVRQ